MVRSMVSLDDVHAYSLGHVIGAMRLRLPILDVNCGVHVQMTGDVVDLHPVCVCLPEVGESITRFSLIFTAKPHPNEP